MRRISPGRRACIRCTNPECGHDYFRPFFRHDRRLFAEVSRLIYEILREFYHEAAGSPLFTGMVIGHQSFGDQLRWNPHFHAIVSDGGFDKGRVLFHTKHSEYFKQNLQMFDALDFFAELTQHIPPKGLQLIRRYGLYASRTKGRRHDMPWVAARAPEGWKATHRHPADAEGLGYEPLWDEEEELGVNPRKRAGARLLAKVYEVDPFVCPKCGAEMKVIAVIEVPDELRRILRHLVRIGRAPPGFDPDYLD